MWRGRGTEGWDGDIHVFAGHDRRSCREAGSWLYNRCFWTVQMKGVGPQIVSFGRWR